MKANVCYPEWYEALPQETKEAATGILQLDLQDELKFAYLREQFEPYGEVTAIFRHTNGEYEVSLRPHQAVDFVQLNLIAKGVFEEVSDAG